jgi:hypothetical protein
MDGDALGFVENKGWKAPGEMLASYRTLEGLRGVPEDQLVRIPTDPENAEQVNEYHRRLGRPDTAEGYKLPKVEVAEGAVNLEPDFRAWAHKHGLSQSQAEGLFGEYTAKSEAIAAEIAAAREQQVQIADFELKREWGAEYEANMAHGKRFASVFGLPEDWLARIEDVSGYKGLLQGAAKIGRAIAEHKFADGDEPGAGDQPFGLTPDAAKTQIAELVSNEEFLLPYQNRSHPGHKAAVEKMERLQKLAVAGR